MRIFLLLCCILVSTSASARIGETLDSLKARLGEPNVEQPDRGVYGWSANEDGTVFHIVIVDDEGRSVAEHLKSYGGATLERDTVTDFFARQLGHIRFIDRFVDSSSIVFQGVELKFAPGTGSTSIATNQFFASGKPFRMARRVSIRRGAFNTVPLFGLKASDRHKTAMTRLKSERLFTANWTRTRSQLI